MFRSERTRQGWKTLYQRTLEIRETSWLGFYLKQRRGNAYFFPSIQGKGKNAQRTHPKMNQLNL